MKRQEYYTKLGGDIYNQLKLHGGYVKGYGEQVRVMTADHSPVFNVPKQDMQWLIDQRIITQEGIIYILNPDHERIFKSIQ